MDDCTVIVAKGNFSACCASHNTGRHATLRQWRDDTIVCVQNETSHASVARDTTARLLKKTLSTVQHWQEDMTAIREDSYMRDST